MDLNQSMFACNKFRNKIINMTNVINYFQTPLIIKTTLEVIQEKDHLNVNIVIWHLKQ